MINLRFLQNRLKFEGTKLNFLSYIAAPDYLGKASEARNNCLCCYTKANQTNEVKNATKKLKTKFNKITSNDI